MAFEQDENVLEEYPEEDKEEHVPAPPTERPIVFSRKFHIIGAGDIGKIVMEDLIREHSEEVSRAKLSVLEVTRPEDVEEYLDKYGHPPLPPQEPQPEPKGRSFSSKIKSAIFGGDEGEAMEDYQKRLDAFNRQSAYAAKLEAHLEGCAEDDIILIFGSMDDPDGFLNAKNLAGISKKKGLFTIVTVFLPRRLESAKEIEPWDRMLQSIRLYSDVVFVLPNYILISHKGVSFFVHELMELVLVPGVVNLDLADVRTTTKGGCVGMVAFGSSKPEDKHRVKEAFRRALRNPLFRIDVLSASKVLVNVYGGEDMSLKDAETVAEEIGALVKPNTRIIWGATVSESYSGLIHIFLMVGIQPREVLVHLYANSD